MSVLSTWNLSAASVVHRPLWVSCRLSGNYDTSRLSTQQMPYASLTLAQILFPQSPAIWRTKSCHFSGTKSVKTARWRTVCAMSCHLSRQRHELFTKYVTSDVDFVVTSRDTCEKFFEKFMNISKFSPRHGAHYFTCPASPRIPHTHCYEFFPHWHAKLGAMALTVCRASVRLALAIKSKRWLTRPGCRRSARRPLCLQHHRASLGLHTGCTRSAWWPSWRCVSVNLHQKPTYHYHAEVIPNWPADVTQNLFCPISAFRNP